MKLIIKNRFTAAILFEYETENNSIAITLKAAISAGADLRGANLYGANLRSADLYGANLYGANLRGANLYGEILTKTPLQLNNLKWPILISDNFLTIGCQRHSFAEWNGFADEQINKMHSCALRFWRKSKVAIMALCELHKVEK